MIWDMRRRTTSEAGKATDVKQSPLLSHFVMNLIISYFEITKTSLRRNAIIHRALCKLGLGNVRHFDDWTRIFVANNIQIIFSERSALSEHMTIQNYITSRYCSEI